MGMDKPHDFALLIGKRLDKKEAPDKLTDDEHAKDLGLDEGDQMGQSACADLIDAINAKDIKGAWAALQDAISLAKEPPSDDEQDQSDKAEPPADMPEAEELQ